MLVKNAENREQLEFVSLENMVPQDHLLRKIDDAIDFKKIYEFVEDLYCEDNGENLRICGGSVLRGQRPAQR